jgi:hypothetical protein
MRASAGPLVPKARHLSPKPVEQTLAHRLRFRAPARAAAGSGYARMVPPHRRLGQSLRCPRRSPARLAHPRSPRRSRDRARLSHGGWHLPATMNPFLGRAPPFGGRGEPPMITGGRRRRERDAALAMPVWRDVAPRSRRMRDCCATVQIARTARFRRICAITAKANPAVACRPKLAAVQGFALTERRWNRTIQAWGCHALPVLKINMLVLATGRSGPFRVSASSAPNASRFRISEPLRGLEPH